MPRPAPGSESVLPNPFPSRCPVCEGLLSPPVSGDVHCYVYCLRCGTEFQLDDPRLTVPRTDTPG